VLAGNQADVSHERTRRTEASEVVQLGDQADGGDRVDAFEAA
jgi:hypothetical protein